MPEASSLRDLLRIREANREAIEAINGNLGSALGRKKATHPGPEDGKPAVLVFVPRKIKPKWIPAGQEIPKVFHGPEGLTCPVDVVEGGKFEDTILRAVDPETEEDRFVYWSDLRGATALSAAKLNLREGLRGWSDRVTPGSQIAGYALEGYGYLGTLGCFARDRTTGQLGFITNQHVGDHEGNVLFFPLPGGRRAGIVQRMHEFVLDQKRFAGLVDEPNALFRIDCAFVALHEELPQEDIDPNVPILRDGGEVALGRLGSPAPLNLESMEPIGQRVVGVGRTRSFQRGTIVAFAYEYWDEHGDSRYTDYLIVGEEGEEFSDHGDSGKLIMTDDADLRPIALLWGGWQERLRRGREQENWTYAIDINFVLGKLGVDIVRQF